MPVGAFGGRSDVMEKLAPSGPVYQAGTLSGNPIAMRAGLETLKEFYEKDAYCKMNSIGALLEQKISELISAYSNIKFTRIGSMFTLFFHDGAEIKNVDDVGQCDFEKFGRFFNFMLREKKILLPPSQYEANFLACVHTEEHVQRYVDGVKEFLEKES